VKTYAFAFNALLPIFPTGADEIKQLSIILVQLRFVIFGISALNIRLLKGEVIVAMKNGLARLIGAFHICSPSFSSPVMEITAIFLGRYL
jgi:hypothetical protein